MNKSGIAEDADVENQASETILSNPQDYDVTIEKAEIPISQIPLDILEHPLRIIIDYPKDLPAHATLQPGENYFEISGAYYSIHEFLEKVNVIMSTVGGSFGFKQLDNRQSRILYKFGDASDRASLAQGIEIYFERGIKELLEGFETLYSEMPPGYLGETATFFKLDWVGYLGSNPGVVLTEQPRYLLSRFFGFKSVRIFSNLPTIPYYIFDQVTSKVAKTNMLSEIVLNSDDYSEGLLNTLYIPAAFRYTQMTGSLELSTFRIWFYIHYRNGKDHRLKIAPNEYLSLTLAFLKREGVSP